MSDGTSVGKIQLDLEISKSSISKELQGLNKVIGAGIQNTLSSSLSHMNGFVKNAIGNMFNGFKKFNQIGKSANDEVSKSVSDVNAKYEKTKEKIAQVNSELFKLCAQQDAIARNYEGMPSFTGMSKDESIQRMLSGDKSYNQLGSEIDKLEAKLKRLTPELEQAENKNEQLKDSLNRTDNSAKKASRGIKLFGDNAKKSEKKVGGLAATINRSLMTVLRRVFIYSVILKAIRGIVNYMTSALKTNKQFASSLNAIQTNLRVAFQPIYDFILPALNALMSAVAKTTTYIASAISSLFGKSYKQSYDSAKGIETSKKAMDGYGKSAKKASGALANFDEINVLDIADDDSGASSGFEMEIPDTSDIDLTGFDKFKNILQPTIASLERLGLALEPLKTFASTALQDFYNNFLVPVGQWTFGEGLPRFISAITEGLSKINWQPIKDGLNNLWSALTPFALNVGEGLLWFWENALVPLGTWTMNNVVPLFLNILAEGIKVLNIVIEALKPLGMWLWDNFLEPLSKWTGGIIISVLDGIKNSLKGLGEWVYDNQEATEAFFAIFATWKAATFVVEMSKATTAIIANTAAILAGKVETIAITALYAKDFIINLRKATVALIINTAQWLTSTTAMVAAKVATIASTVAQVAMTAATTAWSIAAGIATTVTTAFGVAIAFLTSPIGLVILAIGAVIAIVALLIKHWDEVSLVASKCWDWIKETWSAAGEWFNVTVIKPITTIFNNLKDSIKNALSMAWTWVTDIWKGAGNWFKGIGEDMFNGMWDGLKSVWESIKNWIADTVDWLKDKLSFWKSGKEEMSSNGGSGSSGGTANAAYNKNKQAEMTTNKDAISAISKTKDVDMDTAYNMWKASSIPQLARGGIVDQPTLAMVGERGREAVMPLENNIGWISELAGQIANVISNIGDSEEINITIPVYLDNEKIYEGQQKVKRRRGGSLVKGALA